MSYNTRYTVSRDRLADLRNASDSTEAFGPSRPPGGRNQTPTPTRESYELQQVNVPEHGISPSAVTNITTMDGYLAEVDDISSAIRKVHLNIDRISGLHDSSLSSTNEQQWKQSSHELKQYEDQTSIMNKNVKNRIKALEASNTKHKKNSDLNIRKVQVARIKKDFIACIQRYKDVEGSFNQRYRQRVARQVRIVKQDVTDEEIDEIIESDQQNQIFANSLSRTGQARAVLSEVQTRHDDIKRIQKTIFELAQLFDDMQMMVEEQGHVFDQVEEHAANVEQDVEKGNDHISRAVVLARSTRAKKWCCFFIAIGVAVMIAILVWWFAFGHPGVNTSGSNNK
ncbi:t-SNARE [Backusella circina FSU 941]|nr:t-SNARE [Backusella circina FSU 941]